MSQKASLSPPPTPTRPYLLDYVFLLSGCGLSLYLMDLHPWTVEAEDYVTPYALRSAIAFLPRLTRLADGVILLFPLFFLPQFVLGRRQEIASGEWLWILAWFGTVALVGVAVVRHLIGLPEWLDPYAQALRWIWYLGFGTAMTFIALILVLYGLFRRAPMPWTHGLGLVLVVWPMLPLVGILVLTKK
jgi:hypothetical protein